MLDFVQVLDEPWFRQIRFNDLRGGLALALGAANALHDRPALAHILLRLGEIEVEQNEYGAAEAHLAEATHHFLALEDDLGCAHAQYLLGRIKVEQAEDGAALALFEASKESFAGAEDWLGVAKNLNLIAVCHFKLTRSTAEAQTYLEEAVERQHRLPLSPCYVETLRHLARIKVMAGAYVEAEDCLVQASETSRRLNDLGETAAVLYERTLLSKSCDQLDEALAFGYECLDGFKALGSLRWEALIKTQLGLLHQAKAELHTGLALLSEGLQIFLELGDLYEQAYSYYYLHKLYAELNEPGQSQQAKEHARRLNFELNDPQLRARLK